MIILSMLNWLDYLLIFILILNLYNGLRYGFLRQVAGLVGLFIALYAALAWSGALKGYLKSFFDLEEVITTFATGWDASSWLAGVIYNIVCFLIIFCLFSFLLGVIIGKLSIFNKIPLIGPLNVFLGGILGALKGLLLVFLVSSLISLLETSFWLKAFESSAVIALSRHYMPLLFGFVFDFIVGRLGRLI